MTHSDPTRGTDPGIEHEERHAVDTTTDADPRLHDGPQDIASDVESNVIRPAGPDIRAENTAAAGYDPEMPPPSSEAD